MNMTTFAFIRMAAQGHEVSYSSDGALHALLFAVARRRRVHRSLTCTWLCVHAGSLTTKIPSNPARNSARARNHQAQQEQHALDSSLLAVIASAAGDESRRPSVCNTPSVFPDGDGMRNRDGRCAPLGAGAREPTPWGNHTIGRDELRAPLEKGMEEPWFDGIALSDPLHSGRSHPAASSPTPRRAAGHRSVRARRAAAARATRTQSRSPSRTTTGDEWPRGSTQKRFRQAIKVTIWFLEIVLDALQRMERRIR